MATHLTVSIITFKLVSGLERVHLRSEQHLLMRETRRTSLKIKSRLSKLSVVQHLPRTI